MKILKRETTLYESRSLFRTRNYFLYGIVREFGCVVYISKSPLCFKRAPKMAAVIEIILIRINLF